MGHPRREEFMLSYLAAAYPRWVTATEIAKAGGTFLTTSQVIRTLRFLEHVDKNQHGEYRYL